MVFDHHHRQAVGKREALQAGHRCGTCGRGKDARQETEDGQEQGTHVPTASWCCRTILRCAIAKRQGLQPPQARAVRRFQGQRAAVNTGPIFARCTITASGPSPASSTRKSIGATPSQCPIVSQSVTMFE